MVPSAVDEIICCRPSAYHTIDFCSISIFFFHPLPFTEYMHIICLANIPSSPKMTITAEMSP